MRRLGFRALAAVLAAATAFFGYYGGRLVDAALPFEGDGSLGHVGMYIAAGLIPFLAVVSGPCTYLAWRASSR